MPMHRSHFLSDNISAVEPAWKEVIEKNLREQYNINLRFRRRLGAGAFGVVYSTNLPGYVIKITTDLNEGHMLEEIRIQQRGRSSREDLSDVSFHQNDDIYLDPVSILFRAGFCRVFFVGAFRDLKMPSAVYKKLVPVFVVVRENVAPDKAKTKHFDSYIDVVSEFIGGVPTDVLATEEELARKHAERRLADRPAYQQYMSSTRVREELTIALQKVAKHSPNIAAVVQYYLNNGRVFTDLHGGNIGRRTQTRMVFWSRPKEGVGSHVIFDPGMTRPIHARGKTIKRINPSGMDRILARCDGWF